MSDSDPISLTLYNESADRFREIKQDIAENRAGIEPRNSEVVRILIGSYQKDSGSVF